MGILSVVSKRSLKGKNLSKLPGSGFPDCGLLELEI